MLQPKRKSTIDNERNLVQRQLFRFGVHIYLAERRGKSLVCCLQQGIGHREHVIK